MARWLRYLLSATLTFAFCTFLLSRWVPETVSVAEVESLTVRFDLPEGAFEDEVVPWRDEGATWLVETQRLQDQPILSPNVKCSPPSFGLTQAQAADTFTQKKPFRQCCNYNLYSYDNDTLRVICEASSYDVVVGESRQNERLGDVLFTSNWKRNPGPVQLKDSEFAFMRCGLGAKDALLINKFNLTSATRAHNTAKELTKEVNTTAYRPLAVYLVILDSVSRQHFYRNFPDTLDFLRSSGNFSVFDFMLNHASGENTMPNMIPMLYGWDLQHMKRLVEGLRHERPDHTSNFTRLQNESLWKHMENNGFVTLFGYDTVWDFLSPYIGREVMTDHMISNFYHAAKKLFSYNEFSTTQRCIGCHDAHYYPLKYLLDFHSNYQGFNRFAYLHLSPGHETSGTVIRSADPDVRMLVQELAGSQEDVVLMLGSDHGLHVGAWEDVYEGFIENQLPLHLLCVSRGLRQRLGPKVYRTLLTNTQRLVTRYDWHLTLRHFATLPYGQLSSSSSLYSSWKSRSDNPNAVSLLLEEIPLTRSCQDAGIPLYSCACLSFQETAVTKIPSEPLTLATAYLNQQTSNTQFLCMRVTAMDIVKAYLLQGETEQYLKIRFRVNESPKARFDAVFLWSSSKRRYHDRLRSANKSVQNDHFDIRELVRVDPYAGLCEQLAKAFQTSPSLCMCHLPFPDTALQDHSFRQRLEEVLGSLSLVVPDKGSTCAKACESENLSCAQWGLSLLNDERVLHNRTFYFQKDQVKRRLEDLQGISWTREGVGVRLKKAEERWQLLLAEWSRPPTCADQAPSTQPLCACF